MHQHREPQVVGLQHDSLYGMDLRGQPEPMNSQQALTGTFPVTKKAYMIVYEKSEPYTANLGGTAGAYRTCPLEGQVRFYFSPFHKAFYHNPNASKRNGKGVSTA